MKQLLFICIAFWAMSCAQSGKRSSGEGVIEADTIRYAQGFTINRYADYTEVEVSDPWNKDRLLQRYLLVPRGQEIPADMPKGTVVRIPLQRVVVYNSVHSAILEELGASSQIVGACESQYIDSPELRKRLDNGEIADLGESTAPNVEKIVELATEVVLVSPFQHGGYGPVEKLGIPIIECADYMEATPLGRAEWLRLYGLLTGKEAEANASFARTEQNYLALKELAASIEKRPTVLAEKRFGSTWHVPAGESYMAQFFKDAGADYLFADLPGAGSTPLAFESVLDKAIHADIWLVKYNQTTDMTYDELRTEYTPYENFDAFKNKRIYGCNSGKVPYYEEFPMHPDYLLKDMLWVFHPDLLPGYTPRYYKKM